MTSDDNRKSAGDVPFIIGAKPIPKLECKGCNTYQRHVGWQMLPQGYRCRGCVVGRWNA